MHQRALEFGLFAATLFTYLTGAVAVAASAVREARSRGEKLSPARFWLAGVITAYAAVFGVAVYLNYLL